MVMYDLQPGLVSALDIGTSTTSAAMAQVDEDGQLHLLGVGQAPSSGIKKGIVVNMKETVAAIETSVIEAESQANLKMDGVYVALSGEHVRSMNNSGVISINGSDTRMTDHKEITGEDVERVLEQAKGIALPPNSQILHALPQDFKVDQNAGIKDPVGQVGHRLEAGVHLVTVVNSAAQNIIQCVEGAGLFLDELVLAPMASAYSVLDQTEMDQGVALIDIGSGTSDIVVYHDGGVRHTASIPLGGDSITRDVAQILHTTFETAEALKREHGYAKFPATIDELEITIEGIAGRAPKVTSRRGLAEIIEPRVEEILLLCRNEIRRSGVGSRLTFGIVLTGGTVLLKEIEEKAGEVFNSDIKIGYPLKYHGLAEKAASPACATVTGLLRYGMLHGNRGAMSRNGNGVGNLVQNFGEQLKGFFRELF